MFRNCSKPRGDPGVLLQNALGLGAAARGETLREGGVLHGEDLGGQQGGVGPVADADGRHRDARGHLHGAEQRVQPVERRTLAGDADDGERGVGGDGAGQVRGHAGRRKDHAEAVLPGLARKVPRLHRCAVGGVDMRLKGVILYMLII